MAQNEDLVADLRTLLGGGVLSAKKSVESTRRLKPMHSEAILIKANSLCFPTV